MSKLKCITLHSYTFVLGFELSNNCKHQIRWPYEELRYSDKAFADMKKRVANSEVEDVTSNKEVQAVGKYSVEEYNRLKGNKDNDGQLIFVKVVEAEKQVVSGMKYYLKIQAFNKTSGEVKVFEAVVVVKPWLRKKELVKFAPSQKTMSILQPVW
ncbi:cysteine proteinase inhibitor B-like protein [Tanacetum coccineum]